MPSKYPLENVPLELLQEICSFLSGPDLHAISYSSKTWRQASVHLLFAGVVVPVVNDRPSLRHVGGLRKTSRTFYASNLKHIRQLTVRDLTIEGWVPHRVSLSGESDDMRHRPEEPCHRSEEIKSGHHSANFVIEMLNAIREEAWQPLAEFIRFLPALRCLIYDCTSQLPACLLEVLEHSQPSCGLYLRTFCFRSLAECPLTCPQVEPYELRLAKSPNLRGISLFSHFSEYEAVLGRDLEVIEDLLLGMAFPPRRRDRAGNNDYLEEDTTVLDVLPRKCASRQVNALSNAETTRPSVTSFAYYACGPADSAIHTREYTEWIDLAVRSMLQSLQIFSDGGIDPARSLAHGAPLANLKRLCIRVYAREYDPVGRFLEALPPLRDLELHGEIASSILDTILMKHGSSVRRLILPWLNDTGRLEEYAISVPLIEKVQESCPVLDELGLTIARSFGDQRERATYQALGKFKSLHRLVLNLDCAVTPRTMIPFSRKESSFRLEARSLAAARSRSMGDALVTVTRSELRTLLINCAIDARLAKAIYRNIAKYTPKGFFPPERVDIRGVRPGLLCKKADIRNFQSVDVEFNRSWRCSLNFEDFMKPKVEETGVEEREARERDYEKESRSRIALCEKVMSVFRELWPGEDRDWRTNWRSWPLWTESHEG